MTNSISPAAIEALIEKYDYTSSTALLNELRALVPIRANIGDVFRIEIGGVIHLAYLDEDRDWVYYANGRLNWVSENADRVQVKNAVLQVPQDKEDEVWNRIAQFQEASVDTIVRGNASTIPMMKMGPNSWKGVSLSGMGIVTNTDDEMYGNYTVIYTPEEN